MISLAGLGAGFVVYMLCAVGGLATLLLAVPLAFGAVQWCGAGYLLWLAWNAVKPGARSVFEARPDLPFDPPHRLFAMGILTALLNPKIAVLYLPCCRNSSTPLGTTSCSRASCSAYCRSPSALA